MCANRSEFTPGPGVEKARPWDRRLDRAQQWAVRLRAVNPRHHGRLPAGVAVATDLELAASGLCDRLSAPVSDAEGWYLLAAYLPAVESGIAPAQVAHLQWSNRLDWDGSGWRMGEWVPATGVPW